IASLTPDSSRSRRTSDVAVVDEFHHATAELTIPSPRSCRQPEGALWRLSRVRHGQVLARIRRDQYRALTRNVGLLAVLRDVHADRLVVLTRTQWHHALHELQQYERGRECICRRDEGGERLMSELCSVSVDQAVGNAVP